MEGFEPHTEISVMETNFTSVYVAGGGQNSSDQMDEGDI